MTAKVSARNVFEGRVEKVVPGAVNAEVDVVLPGGDKLVAIVTQASVRELGLAAGQPVVAIVKAPWVMVAADDSALRFSARNQLRGKVASVKRGPINAEVAIQLDGGATVHAVITDEAAGELGLKPGSVARAVIKANHVVLAVRG